MSYSARRSYDIDGSIETPETGLVQVAWVSGLLKGDVIALERGVIGHKKYTGVVRGSGPSDVVSLWALSVDRVGCHDCGNVSIES